jgi:hypothetical protein
MCHGAYKRPYGHVSNNCVGESAGSMLLFLRHLGYIAPYHRQILKRLGTLIDGAKLAAMVQTSLWHNYAGFGTSSMTPKLITIKSS